MNPETPNPPLPPPTPGASARGPLPIGLSGLTDEELDRFVETRLRIIGVDLSVLPEDDPDAPADRVRVLRSARGFLRQTVPALSAFDLDPQTFPPVSYPAALPGIPEADHGG
jgi:hypothetical protein